MLAKAAKGLISADITNIGLHVGGKNLTHTQTHRVLFDPTVKGAVF